MIMMGIFPEMDNGPSDNGLVGEDAIIQPTASCSEFSGNSQGLELHKVGENAGRKTDENRTSDVYSVKNEPDMEVDDVGDNIDSEEEDPEVNSLEHEGDRGMDYSAGQVSNFMHMQMQQRTALMQMHMQMIQRPELMNMQMYPRPEFSSLQTFQRPENRIERERRKRRSLTLEERVRVIENYKAGRSARSIAINLGVGKTQIQSIVNNRDTIMKEWESGTPPDQKYMKARCSKYGQLNDLVWDWFCAQRANNVTVTGKMIQDRAKILALELGYMDFTASNGWLESFQRRNAIRFAAGSDRLSLIAERQSAAIAEQAVSENVSRARSRKGPARRFVREDVAVPGSSSAGASTAAASEDSVGSQGDMWENWCNMMPSLHVWEAKYYKYSF